MKIQQSKSHQLLKRLTLASALLASCASWVMAQDNPREPLTIEQAEIVGSDNVKISQTRVGRGIMLFEYQASLTNKTDQPLTDVTATVTKTEREDNNILELVETTLTFPEIAPGASALSNETFTMKIDRTKLFSWDNIAWEITVPATEPETPEEPEEPEVPENPNPEEPLPHPGFSIDPEAVIPEHPGEAGKETLEGIDSDGDGIRDDLELAVYERFVGDALRNVRYALYQEAQVMQEKLLATDSGDSNRIEAIRLSDDILACLLLTLEDAYEAGLIDEDTKENADLWQRTLAINTPERAAIYSDYNQYWSGRMIPVEIPKHCDYSNNALIGL